MSGPRNSILALVMAATMAACGSSANPTAADESLFVKTMADLRRIRVDKTLDSAGRDSAREATLQTHGVSREELVEMARQLARDPERALEEWREIERLAVHDTTHETRSIDDGGTPR